MYPAPANSRLAEPFVKIPIRTPIAETIKKAPNSG